MKNLMGLVMAAIVMGLVFASCNKDEIADHSNKEEGKAKLIIDEKPGPQPVLTDSVWGKIVNDSLIIVHDSLRNDTVFKTETASLGFSASIKREHDERKTTVERIKKLDFSFEDAVNKQDGKMNFIGSQKGNDMDAQNYTLNFSSEKLSKWGLSNVHFELVGTSTPETKNTDIEKKASDSIRIKSEMTWPLTVKVVNVPNLKDKEFKSSMLNKTNHERYISYGDAVLVKRDTTMVPTIGTWSTEWLLKVKETYRVNGKDSIYEPTPKKVTLVSTCGIDKNEDAFVGSLDFNHSFNSEKWSNWYDVESADKSVSVQERRFERLGTGSNGIAKDEFATRSFVTEQKATVVFAGLTWNIPATNATLTNVRHTFLEQDSDLDGYSMLKFVDDEIATYNNETNENEPNYKKLNSSCKLYLKLAEPEVEKFLFDQDVKHTTDKVTVTTTGTPVYDNGAKGKSATFVLEEPETFKCLDEFAFEKVAEVSETTGAMEKDGEVVKTKQTKNVKSGEYTGTYTYYKYEQKYRQPITCNGETKYQHWLATWYDDFSFVVKSFENKNYAKVASYSAIVEKDANHLTKSTSLSTEDLEVWLYSINGTFKLDNVERKDIGNGRITKVIGENYWDESTKGREITALEVKSWCEFIRFKSDGTKTSQKYTHVFNRVSGTSTWEVSAEKAEEVNGDIIPLAPVDNNRIDDFCHFTARLYEYDMTVDIQGAAQQKDFAKFTEAEEMYFEVEGKKVYFENPTHSISNTVRNLTVKSESDSETVYNHENVWSWNYGGVVTEVTSTGLIHVAKSTPVTPDFDIEVGKIFASVSRPSNRNGVNGDITAYTYLLVSKDGKKCLPLGIYHDVVTVGEITNMQAGFNSACYVKDENKVVATRAYSDSGLGMMIWCGADGNPVDAASHLVLQGAGFNDRGNDWVNHTGKYAPRATKKGNVTVVTFEGTNVSYTFRGWNV